MVPRWLGWSILALVLLDELLAVAAAAVWGHHARGLWLALPAGAAVVVAWALWASPRAPYGGPVRRPVAQVTVLGLAGAGLWAAGRPGWAAAFWVFSLVAHALARLPSVRALAAEEAAR